MSQRESAPARATPRRPRPAAAAPAPGPAPAAGPGRGAEAPGSPFDGIRSCLIRRAAERVQARWKNERGDSADALDLIATLGWMSRALDAALAGESLPDGATARTPLGRHLLDLLRGEVLDHWSGENPPETAGETVVVMAAFERVARGIEPDWSGFLTSRLTSPDGLNLVVEVAHDLRSPVTSILFLAETLGRGQSGPLNELQKRQLRLVYSAALNLSTMASDVIEMARGGDNVVEKDLAPFSIRELVEGVCDMVRPIAEEKGLELKYQTPPTDRRIGRGLALSRVLLNLTSNALKFTREGFVEITAVARGLSDVEFGVQDTGPGMSEEAIASLYQPFRRSRSREGRGGYYFSGTGLGLAMCRKLVTAMGGELAFTNEPGSGTRFHFQLDLPPASHM